MDLGLAGRKAIVCASSRGLGKACATALSREGVSVVINGLDEKRLAATADEIRQLTGGDVVAVRADINTPDGREILVNACPEADILVNNNAGPPPGKFQDWEEADWLAALQKNMLAPVFMMKALLPGMRARKFGRIVNITSAMVTSPKFAYMGLSTAARLGLHGISKSLSRDAAADNVTINNMLPERIDTDRQIFMAKRLAEAESITYDEARVRIAASLPAKRFGRPEEFGDTCAFLCSINAGFITGQNIHLDGGSHEAIL